MKKIITLFVIMGLLYLDMEVAFRAINCKLVGVLPNIKPLSLAGWTSLWMLIVGGLSGVALGLLNEINFIRKNFNVFFQVLLGTVIVLLFELTSGIIFNLKLKLNIWDYSDLPYNFLGQISLLHAFFWFFLCPFVFWIDDVLRNVLYKKGNIYNLKDLYCSLFKFWEEVKHYQELL